MLERMSDSLNVQPSQGPGRTQTQTSFITQACGLHHCLQSQCLGTQLAPGHRQTSSASSPGRLSFEGRDSRPFWNSVHKRCFLNAP